MDTFWNDKPVGGIHFVNFGNLEPTYDTTVGKSGVKRAQNESKHHILTTEDRRKVNFAGWIDFGMTNPLVTSILVNFGNHDPTCDITGEGGGG